MEDTKILEVIGLYRQKLISLDVRGIPYSHEKQLPLLFHQRIALDHALQMLDKMETFVHEGRRGKAFRWLGFIQGLLWTNGVYTLEEMMNHNRPAA